MVVFSKAKSKAPVYYSDIKQKFKTCPTRNNYFSDPS